MKLATLAGTASFAHLLGRGGPAAAKRAEEEDDDKKRAEDRDEDKKDEGDDAKKGKRAESPDREEEDEDRDEDRDEERDDAKKGKAAKKAESEDDDDDEEGDDGSDGADMRKRGSRAARLRERARCAAIFADAAAGNNPALAAQLAFGTDLPRSQAVAVLRSGAIAPAQRRKSLDDRMAAAKTPAVGAGDASTAAPNLADQIIAAGRKARGEA